jgi:plasmid stabilization system protein ParE
MKSVTFDSEAEDELRAAASYYENQRAGLGDDFVAEVEQGVQRILQMPQAFPLHSASGLRKCILRRFPYTIYFLDLPDRIWIAAVAHQKRRPGYWSHRQP